MEGYSNELTRHGAEVTAGDGRLLACLHAQGDKLSGQCEYELYEAANRLERTISPITCVASECAQRSKSIVRAYNRAKALSRSVIDHATQPSPGCDQELTNVGME